VVGVGRIENLGAVSADRVGAVVVDIGGCIEFAILEWTFRNEAAAWFG
jgi:hypothetical protein